MEHLQSLTGLNLLFYLANTLWLLEFIFFRNQNKQGRFQEKKSFWFLTTSIGLVIVVTISLSRVSVGTLNETSWYAILQLIALMGYGVGLFLRYAGSLSLGKNFTRHVAVSPHIVLVSHGPYRYLRHPLYLGLFLITLSFPLYVGNLLAFVLTAPWLITGFIWRMRVEEKALTLIHPDYAQWKKSRFRFIPFIY